MTRSQAALLEQCRAYGCEPGNLLMADNGNRKVMMSRMIADGLIEPTPPNKVTSVGRDALTKYQASMWQKKRKKR